MTKEKKKSQITNHNFLFWKLVTQELFTVIYISVFVYNQQFSRQSDKKILMPTMKYITFDPGRQCNKINSEIHETMYFIVIQPKYANFYLKLHSTLAHCIIINYQSIIKSFTS